MTLYVVLGDGEMPPKEVSHQLEDLWDKAEAEDQDFWFALLAKETPTATDLTLVKYFNDKTIHYALIVPPGIPILDQYTGVAEYLDTTSTLNGVKFALTELPAEGESAVLLGLFVNIEEDDPADGELLDYMALAIQNGRNVFALNDSMEPVEIRTEEVTPLDTVEPAKKVETVKQVDENEDDLPDALEPLDREYLEGLRVGELKELCKGMGIPYTNKDASINSILAAAGQPNVEPEEVAPSRTASQNSAPETTGGASVMVLLVAHYPDGMVSKWVPASAVDPIFA